MTRMIKNGLLMAVAIGVIGIATGCGGGSSAPAVKEWQTEEVFKDAKVIRHDFKLNQNGDGFAVWAEKTVGTTYRVMAKRYHNGAWGTESSLGTYSGVQSFRTIKLAVQETGDSAIVSWLIKKTTNTFELYGTVFDGTSWQSPIKLHSNTQAFGIDRQIAVAIDDNSNTLGLVLFSTKNGSGKYDIRYKIYRNSWLSTLYTLDTATPDARQPDIAFDGDQKFVMAWQQGGKIYARYFLRTGMGYASVGGIKQVNENIMMTSCAYPKVMFTRNHTAVAMWGQGSIDNFLYAGTFNESSTNWTEGLKNNDSEKVGRLVLAADNKEKDKVVVLREEKLAPPKKKLMAASFDTNAVSWDEMEQLNNDDDHVVSSVDLASDSNGNMMAVWSEWKPGEKLHIYANYYDQVAAGWNGAKALGDQSDNTFAPKVAFDGSKAMVHWRQQDGGKTNIYSNTYE